MYISLHRSFLTPKMFPILDSMFHTTNCILKPEAQLNGRNFRTCMMMNGRAISPPPEGNS